MIHTYWVNTRNIPFKVRKKNKVTYSPTSTFTRPPMKYKILRKRNKEEITLFRWLNYLSRKDMYTKY